MARTIIGLTGRKQSGKTTAAEHLLKSGFVRLSFADGIRDMLLALFLKLDYEEYDVLDMLNDKERYIAPLGKTYRQMMQTLGTEWGRELIHPDLWVMAARAQIEMLGNYNCVFDDVRFENEAALIRELGGLIIHIDRDGLATDTHTSESGISVHPADMFIINHRSLNSFLIDVALIVAGHIHG